MHALGRRGGGQSTRGKRQKKVVNGTGEKSGDMSAKGITGLTKEHAGRSSMHTADYPIGFSG